MKKSAEDAWKDRAHLIPSKQSWKNLTNRALLLNTTVAPSMLCGSETWSLTKSEENRLTVTERAMERRMLKMTKPDHVCNEDVRQRTKVVDVVLESRKSKLRWAGHVARLRDDRWTKKVSD
ncbi:hypothetical protein AB6A40_002251 [Gnathostoma spinigerum]|uniref:Endonuclease-reverse transcriptase n=1 Tax=Gnathostoma spinigerum TaxID=75299 RepID=A0ABD6EFT7_9BILA